MSFNCAAPFRGRLRRGRLGLAAAHLLQLCRPLPGAVTEKLGCAGAKAEYASIVPPPSGGGYRKAQVGVDAYGDASIVPPPSGGGYPALPIRGIERGVASIVPPPSGGGYR